MKPTPALSPALAALRDVAIAAIASGEIRRLMPDEEAAINAGLTPRSRSKPAFRPQEPHTQAMEWADNLRSNTKTP